MKIEDLRNIYTNSRVDLIELGGESIYYAEEKVEEGHNSLFLLEYNRRTKRERVVTNYILNDPSFVHHYFAFPSEILMVTEDGGSEVWILALEKESGHERRMARLSLLGSFCGCTALDSSRLLLWTKENDGVKELFSTYRKITGQERVCYLYDLDEERYWFVRDPRLISATPEDIVPCQAEDAAQLLVLEPHGDEAEKEKCYRNRRWLGDNVKDSVWLCPLLDLVVSLKAGEPRAPMELVLSTGTSGLLRYAGMDAEGLYFRAKYFPDEDERIIEFRRRDGAKQAVCRLPQRENSRLLFLQGGSSAPFRAYVVEDRGDFCRCEGVFRASLTLDVSKELGEPIACVEDRYLVARYILADDKDSFEFHTVLDAKTGSQQSYECRCAVSGPTVVLY